MVSALKAFNWMIKKFCYTVEYNLHNIMHVYKRYLSKYKYGIESIPDKMGVRFWSGWSKIQRYKVNSRLSYILAITF